MRQRLVTRNEGSSGAEAATRTAVYQVPRRDLWQPGALALATDGAGLASSSKTEVLSEDLGREKRGMAARLSNSWRTIAFSPDGSGLRLARNRDGYCGTQHRREPAYTGAGWDGRPPVFSLTDRSWRCARSRTQIEIWDAAATRRNAKWVGKQAGVSRDLGPRGQWPTVGRIARSTLETIIRPREGLSRGQVRRDGTRFSRRWTAHCLLGERSNHPKSGTPAPIRGSHFTSCRRITGEWC